VNLFQDLNTDNIPENAFRIPTSGESLHSGHHMRMQHKGKSHKGQFHLTRSQTEMFAVNAYENGERKEQSDE